MNSTMMKQVAEVRLGGFSVTLDWEKLGLLHGLGNQDSREIRQIHEMTDWLLDLCCDGAPSEGDCLKYMKYLKNLRGAFECLQRLGVKEEEGGER
ncbi:MAG: hypothetical protein IKR50_00050 [Prevotella sp.]|jgi:hypothetical protein|nr:hypothetical protein [Prevotella sp.]